MIDFKDFINNIEIKLRENNMVSPLNASYEVTNNCNLACVHCYNRDAINSTKPPSLQKKLDIIHNIYSLGVLDLIICGGEPLLDKDILKVIEKCKNLGMRLIILTNGILLNQTMIFKLEEMFGKYDIIQVSYDEIDNNETDRQRKLTREQLSTLDRNIILLEKSKLNVEYNITVTSLNQNDIERIVTKLISLGAKKIASTPYVPLGGEKYDILKPNYNYLMQVHENVKRIAANSQCDYLGGIDGHVCQRPNRVINKDRIEEKRIRECTASEFKIHIDCDGNVYPCVFMVDDKFKIGNILGLNDEFIAKMNIIKDNIQGSLPLKCKSCGLIEECQGGCPGLIFDRYKEFNRVDPRCIN